ncbi:MAG: Amuc_1101 family PilM-like pilus complex protein [Verrucomicrobiota bacterium]
MAKGKPIITLDLGSQRVTMAVFGAAGKSGLALQQFETTELLGDPAAEGTRIAQLKVAVSELASKCGLKGGDVRVAISGHSVITRLMKPPALDEDQVEQIVEFEAQQQVPFPLDEVTWDYQLVKNQDGEIEVVLVAIKTDALDELSEAVEESGLRVEQADVAPMAIYNAFRYNYSDVAEPTLVMDIGARVTNLVLTDGDRVYVRSIPVGGTAVTQQVAKEFGMDFADAEGRKLADGFVSLGGAYADHEDEGIAAMSKVIRNTMTRLHAEITRTISAFRQQGGSPPQRAFLCGACSGLPYLREFFEEKLAVTVEYLNPLRSVSIGPKVDSEYVGGIAHTLGENVGLALRGISACPVEIDLPPTRVVSRRDLAKRQPFLVTAGLALLATLGAGTAYFAKAGSLTDEKLAEEQSINARLSDFDNKISDQAQALRNAQVAAKPLYTAVSGRTFWIEVFQHLNSAFNDEDRIWLVQVEPLEDGRPMRELSRALYSNSSPEGEFPREKPDSSDPRGQARVEEDRVIDAIRVYGLYREEKPTVVFNYYQNLVDADRFFDITADMRDKLLGIKTGNPDVWAQLFTIDLPLREPIYID